MKSYDDILLFLNAANISNKRILLLIKEKKLDLLLDIHIKKISVLNFFTNKEKERLLFLSKDFNLEQYKASLSKLSIKYITIFNSDYPEKLTQIYNPPAILFYKGNLSYLKDALAVVGSRQMTNYGLKACHDIIYQLKDANLGIVSGMALGIDRQAHIAAIKNGLKTIGVLASSIDIMYPKSNHDLYHAMDKQLLVSEFGLNTYPLKHHFVSRNRIIAGISDAVLLIEAKQRSGSLITANYALEQDKTIFALPGSIYSEHSQGCHEMIKKGAKLVSSGEDILEELTYIREVNKLI